MPPPPRPAYRQPQVLLSDLTRELLWTRSLRAPAMALRPSRVILGMAGALLASVIGSIHFGDADQPTIAEEVSAAISGAFGQAAEAITGLDAGGLADAVATLALFPGRLLLDRPLAAVLLAVPMIVIFALFGGAIARAVTVEFATARSIEWTESLRTALARLGGTASALIAPLAIVGLLVLGMAAGGLLLGVPVLDVIGAVLYGLGMIIALLALGILVLHALALPMLAPALMCEGTDAFDAVQRCYAYILARPLRLLAHGALLLVLGVVSIAIIAAVARQTDHLATWASARFTPDAGLRVLNGADELTATQPAAHAVINFWRAIADLIVSGFTVSYFFTAGSILYLIARRVCDGQDTMDIWDPAEDA
jgi:hypothetical protein